MLRLRVMRRQAAHAASTALPVCVLIHAYIDIGLQLSVTIRIHVHRRTTMHRHKYTDSKQGHAIRIHSCALQPPHMKYCRTV